MSRGRRAAPTGRRRTSVRPATGPSTGARRPAVVRDADASVSGPLGFPVSYAGHPRSRAQQRQERRRNRAVGVVTLGLVGLLLAATFFTAKFLFGMTGGSSPDFAGPGSGEVLVKIAEGSTLTAIGRELQQKGVVASAGAFVAAAGESEQNALKISPGWYKLRQEMSGREAVAAMLDPEFRAEIKVTLPEGIRLKTAISRLSAATKIPERDFRVALKKDIGLPAYAEGQVEGFLYPSTYEIAPDATAEDVLRTIVERFVKVATYVDLADSRPGFTPLEILTIASLVEAEARGLTQDEMKNDKVPGDYGKVAQVIYNRLAKDMPLQFDSTVNYARDASERVVTLKHLEVKSPYNTYANRGLPPGPINSPSEAAMRAALAPTPGPWVYFVTTNLRTGETKFAEDHDTFLQYKAELKRYLAANPGKPDS